MEPYNKNIKSMDNQQPARKVKIMQTERQTRTQKRDKLWVEYMKQKSNREGHWYSNKRSRTGLPDAEHITDQARFKALERLVADGVVERVRKGVYNPYPTQETQKTI